MTNPQPPGSEVQPESNGNYRLTLSDGETFICTTNGGIVGGETPATGQAPCNPNSPTTNEDWNQYLANLYPDDSGDGLPWYLNSTQTLQDIYNFASNHPPGPNPGPGQALQQLWNYLRFLAGDL